MGLFGRRSKGRHALGAAVTSIPSAVPAVRVPAGPPAAPVVQPVPESPAAEPPVLASIAQLIATGEAWRSEADLVAELGAPAPVAPSAASAPAAPVVAAPAPPPVAAPAPPPMAAPAPPPMAAPAPSPVAAPPAPVGPRIQLGFRDGTSTTLDADSEQALALELLAQSLTRRD